VRCRLGTYGPHANDDCDLIDNSSVIARGQNFTAVWDTVGARSYEFEPSGGPDSSRDYYSAVSCGAGSQGSNLWRTYTTDLRAVSSAGQPGSPHDHLSYLAEEIPSQPCPF
jgi:hypothetical protein